MNDQRSVLTLLLERSCCDPGVNSFLERVFLFAPQYLQTYRLVCREWNSFIKDQILNRKNNFACQLSRNLQRPPLQILAVKLAVNFQERINDNLFMTCDNDLAIIDVSDLDSGAVLVIDLNLLEQRLISLGGFDFNNGETVKYAIGGRHFCTGFSHDNKITLWDKDGLVSHKTVIFSYDCKYIRTIKMSQDLVLIVGRRTVYVLHISDLSLESVLTLDIPESFGSTRSVVCGGETTVLTAHDRFVQVWTIKPTLLGRKLDTGLVVEMARHQDILFTVGSCQSLGLQVWRLSTSEKLKIFYPDQSFYDIKLAHNKILLRGNSVTTVFVDFLNMEISPTERPESEEDDPYYLSDISETKALFLDVSRQTLLIKHYWQILTDIALVSKSELLPLPLPYPNT